MALRSGLGAQLGFAAESTYGTGVTPTRFLEFTSESINFAQGTIESAGIRSGKYIQRIDRYANSTVGAAGDISYEVSGKGYGLLLKHMLGTSASTASGTGFKRTYTPGDLDGLAMTCQVGRPDTSGTVQPFTYTGGKVTSWEISNAVNGMMMLRTSWDFQNETTATGLATASYPATDPLFSYLDGSATIGGTTTSITNVTITGANNLKTDRRFLGPVTTKKEPLRNGFMDVTGTMTMEFESLTAYNRFKNRVAGTGVAVVLTWASAVTYDTALPYKVVVTMNNVRFDGNTPNVGGPDVLMQELPFRAMTDSTGTASTAIQFDYYTSDSSD